MDCRLFSSQLMGEGGKNVFWPNTKIVLLINKIDFTENGNPRKKSKRRIIPQRTFLMSAGMQEKPCP